jgi:hypothetical protein
MQGIKIDIPSKFSTWTAARSLSFSPATAAGPAGETAGGLSVSCSNARAPGPSAGALH